MLCQLNGHVRWSQARDAAPHLTFASLRVNAATSTQIHMSTTTITRHASVNLATQLVLANC